MQGAKKSSMVRNRSTQLKVTHKRAMNKQKAQTQKKLYIKIRSMPSKSSAAT